MAGRSNVHRFVGMALVGVLALEPVAAAAQSAPTATQAPRVTWLRSARDPRWVRGYVTVAATPDAVRARLRQVATWPQLFSDIQTMRVVRRDGDRWTVELATQTFDCGAHEYHVRFEPDGAVHLAIDAPGVDAVARVTRGHGCARGGGPLLRVVTRA